jgi:integrase/recombinase XerD
VTKLLQRLHDELVRRHYATTTRESYLKILKAFHRHIGKWLDHVGSDDLRRYQVYLLEERRLTVGTVVAQLAAFRFFYLRVLERQNMKEDLPYPKRPRRLPIILSPTKCNASSRARRISFTA